IVTPGPDTALTIRNTLVGGRPAGIATAVGVALGQGTWSLATSVGVSALLVAAEPAFAALKLAGAAYLIYLGAQSLWSAYRARAGDVLRRSGIRRAIEAVTGVVLVAFGIRVAVSSR